MSAKENGGPAFPQSDLSAYGMGPSEISNGGMTLRDWFAGQALAGLLGGWLEDNDPKEKLVAKWAYEFADAMLAERDK